MTQIITTLTLPFKVKRKCLNIEEGKGGYFLFKNSTNDHRICQITCNSKKQIKVDVCDRLRM